MMICHLSYLSAITCHLKCDDDGVSDDLHNKPPFKCNNEMKWLFYFRNERHCDFTPDFNFIDKLECRFDKQPEIKNKLHHAWCHLANAHRILPTRLGTWTTSRFRCHWSTRLWQTGGWSWTASCLTSRWTRQQIHRRFGFSWLRTSHISTIHGRTWTRLSWLWSWTTFWSF